MDDQLFRSLISKSQQSLQGEKQSRRKYQSREDVLLASTRELLLSLPKVVQECVYHCSIVHWFDEEIIAALIKNSRVTHSNPKGHETVASLYEQLKGLPFVERFSDRGYSIHDLTRHVLQKYLWTRRRQFYQRSSVKAAEYYQPDLHSNELTDRVWLVEWIYHYLIADEPAALDEVSKLLEEFSSQGNIEICQAMVQVIEEHEFAGRISPDGLVLVHDWRAWLNYIELHQGQIGTHSTSEGSNKEDIQQPGYLPLRQFLLNQHPGVLDQNTQKIVVVGCGHTGLPVAAVLADLGHQVIGVDIDALLVARLQTAKSPTYELGLQELLEKNISAGRLWFTTEYASAIPHADFVLICVNTPIGPHGGADMRYIRSAVRSVGQYLSPGRRTIIVFKSALPLGNINFISSILEEKVSPSADYAVVINPELLREGSAIHDLQHPSRIVLGLTDQTIAEVVAKKLYGSLDVPIVITDPRSAQLIQYASNAFLATKISFINEVAEICASIGVDARQVAAGMGLDHRITPHMLQPGLGFGGSHLARDVRALEFMTEESNGHPQLMRAVLEINRDMRRRFVRRLDRLIGGLEDKTVAIWGLAFKPDTNDLREAAALEVIPDILARGGRVRVYDPAAMDRARDLFGSSERVMFCTDAYDAARGADAVALVTEWNEFKGLDMARVRDTMRVPVLIDGRNIYDPRELTLLGFTYRGIGLPQWDTLSNLPGAGFYPSAASTALQEPISRAN